MSIMDNTYQLSDSITRQGRRRYKSKSAPWDVLIVLETYGKATAIMMVHSLWDHSGKCVIVCEV